MNLTEKAKEFSNAIKNSSEYIELKQIKSVINKNPELTKRIEELKRKQQEMFTQNKSGQKQLEVEVMKLNEEINRISAIPEVNRYFTALNKFNGMMSKMFKIIYDSIEY